MSGQAPAIGPGRKEARVIIRLPEVDLAQAALGGRLRRARQARGLTRYALARAAGLTALQLGLAEQGRLRLSSVELHALTGALHISPRLLHEPGADLDRLRPF